MKGKTSQLQCLNGPHWAPLGHLPSKPAFVQLSVVS